MKKVIKILVVFIAIYACLQLFSFSKEKKAENFFNKDGFPLVIAHGGAKEMFPENTKFAFDEITKYDIDVIELDLRLTKDNLLVTHHDEEIDQTSDHSGKVRDYTYEELKTFNFGYHFENTLDTNKEKHWYRNHPNPNLHPALLEDLFKQYGKKYLFITEIKDEGELGIQAMTQLVALIKKYNLEEKVCVASFIEENMQHFDEIKSDNMVSSISEKRAKKIIYGAYLGYDTFLSIDSQGAQLPTKQGISLNNWYLRHKFKNHNLFLHYWTINDEETMRQLIDAKVDGIITDRVDILLKLKKEMRDKNGI